ncbi:hypothetical protein OROMI_017235 [Orobanche minor]
MFKSTELTGGKRNVVMESTNRTYAVSFHGKETSTECNNNVFIYELPAAARSCSWDMCNSNCVYAGLQMEQFYSSTCVIL